MVTLIKREYARFRKIKSTYQDPCKDPDTCAKKVPQQNELLGEYVQLAV